MPLLELEYEFERKNGDTENVLIEVDEDEAEDYLLKIYSYDDIIQMFDELYYPRLKEKDKQSFTIFGYDGTSESIQMMDEDAKFDMVNEVLYDMIEAKLFDEELKEYFEEDAIDIFLSDDYPVDVKFD